jgi:hypothetical protein
MPEAGLHSQELLQASDKCLTEGIAFPTAGSGNSSLPQATVARVLGLEAKELEELVVAANAQRPGNHTA